MFPVFFASVVICRIRHETSSITELYCVSVIIVFSELERTGDSDTAENVAYEATQYPVYEEIHRSDMQLPPLQS